MGGKSSSQTTEIELPPALEQGAEEVLAAGMESASLPYSPNRGVTIAAFAPQQRAAIQNADRMAGAYGLGTAPGGMGFSQGATTVNAAGIRGYSTGGLYDEMLMASTTPEYRARHNALLSNYSDAAGRIRGAGKKSEPALGLPTNQEELNEINNGPSPTVSQGTAALTGGTGGGGGNSSGGGGGSGGGASNLPAPPSYSAPKPQPSQPSYSPPTPQVNSGFGLFNPAPTYSSKPTPTSAAQPSYSSPTPPVTSGFGLFNAASTSSPKPASKKAKPATQGASAYKVNKGSSGPKKPKTKPKTKPKPSPLFMSAYKVNKGSSGSKNPDTFKNSASKYNLNTSVVDILRKRTYGS